MSVAAKILRIKQVIERTGLSRSSIYDKLNRKSSRFDPDFPPPRELGMRAKGWLDTEIDAYNTSRPRARRTGGEA